MKWPQLVAYTSATLPAAANTWCQMAGGLNSGTDTSSEGTRVIELPDDVTFYRMFAKILDAVAPGAGTSISVIIRYSTNQGGAWSDGLTVTIADAAVNSGDPAGQTPLVLHRGDWITIKVVQTSTPSRGRLFVTCECDTGASNLFQILFASCTALNTSGTGFLPGITGWSGNASLSQDQGKQVTSEGGTIDHLTAVLSAAPTGATKSYRFRTMVDDSLTGAMDLTITDTARRGTDLATTAVAVSAGSGIEVQYDAANTPTTAHVGYSMRFTPATAGNAIWACNANSAFTTKGYVALGSHNLNNASESVSFTAFMAGYKIIKLRVRKYGTMGGSKSAVTALNINGAATAATVTLDDTTQNAEDTTHFPVYAGSGTGADISCVATAASSSVAHKFCLTVVKLTTRSFVRPNDGVTDNAELITVKSSGGDFSLINTAQAALPPSTWTHWMLEIGTAASWLETVSFNVAPASGYFHILSVEASVRFTAAAGWPAGGATYNQGARFDTNSSPGWNCTAPRWIFEWINQYGDTPTSQKAFLAFSTGSTGTQYVRHSQFLGPNAVLLNTTSDTIEFLTCDFLDVHNDTHGFGGFPGWIDQTDAGGTINFRKCSFLSTKGSTITRTAGAINFWGCKIRGLTPPVGSGGDYNVTNGAAAVAGVHDVVLATAANLFKVITAFAENLHAVVGHEHDWLIPRASGSTDFYDLSKDVDLDTVPSSNADAGSDQTNPNTYSLNYSDGVIDGGGAFSIKLTAKPTVAEGAPSGETLSPKLTAKPTLGEGSPAGETCAPKLTARCLRTDGVLSGETLLPKLTAKPTLGDGAVCGEFATGGSIFHQTLGEGVVTTDAFAVKLTAKPSLVGGVVTTDAYSPKLTAKPTLGEGVIETESHACKATSHVTILEGLACLQTMTMGNIFAKSCVDGVLCVELMDVFLARVFGELVAYEEEGRDGVEEEGRDAVEGLVY